MPKTNEPVRKFRIGYVTASIWRNENGDAVFHNVTLQSRYKDEHGEWQDSTSLSHHDLLNAVRVLQRAEDFISAQ